ncbi:hypothetical protein BXZ70DRAFT_101577 [Cristinia sonorae]|uniref:Copper-fist domain-containing protein n=1 Tax=Cristinia sonorae TaxID=1940300 RepID=A0A8K0XR92_9AGAR|nr:hypothetical protein BXZ70DRAFT_101577 [Cristinia sonorae]
MKFACESCIKGHRSSSCTHTERPLFEVKKKGRPVSQCEKCRELRKTKRVHSKCDCSLNKDAEPAMRQLSVKSKRFIPILPALPNGIRDALPQQTAQVQVNPRSAVNSLLNPCHCKDVWSCKCNKSGSSSSGVALAPRPGSTSGLAALADAAALCCSGARMDVDATAPPIAPDSDFAQPITAESSSSQKHPRDCCQPSPKTRPKKPRRHSPKPADKQLRGPELAPLISLSLPSDTPSGPPPLFPDIPPLSSVASIAGSGCCCGFRCTCPGCVEHRGAEHAAKDHSDCPDQCGTCIDYDGGVELPDLGARSGAEVKTAGTSFIDAFFARAAATIPQPPSQRAAGTALDPTNVTVYPTSLFSGEGKTMEERGPAFGLVRLPKLECCNGRCGCPEGSCGCGTSCDGCGGQHEGITGNCCSVTSPVSALAERSTAASESPSVVGLAARPKAKGSCCG